MFVYEVASSYEKKAKEKDDFIYLGHPVSGDGHIESVYKVLPDLAILVAIFRKAVAYEVIVYFHEIISIMSSHIEKPRVQMICNGLGKARQDVVQVIVTSPPYEVTIIDFVMNGHLRN